MEASIARVEAALTAHREDDKKSFDAIFTKLRYLMRIAGVAVVLAGGAMIAGRWLIKAAVTDALVEAHIIQFERVK